MFTHMHWRSFPKVIGCLLLLIVQSVSVAQLAPAPRAPASTPATAAALPESSEVRVLQARLEDAQKHQDQMLTTVWGTLGTIATVAALLVGFGWFANVRMYERDKSALEQSLRATLLDEQRQAREELTKTLQESSRTHREELKAETVKLREDLLKELEAGNKRLAAQLDTQVRGLRSDVSSVKQETLKLKMQEAIRHREESVRQRSLRNALQDSITVLEIAKQIDDADYSLGEALDLVSTDIDGVLGDAAYRIDNFLLAQVIEELGSIKGPHSTAASTLRAKAVTMKTGA